MEEEIGAPSLAKSEFDAVQHRNEEHITLRKNEEIDARTPAASGFEGMQHRVGAMLAELSQMQLDMGRPRASSRSQSIMFHLIHVGSHTRSVPHTLFTGSCCRLRGEGQ